MRVVVLDKISFKVFEESIDYDIGSKLSIRGLNSLMSFLCGKARVKRHKLLAVRSSDNVPFHSEPHKKA